jgi:Zn-finger protein
MPGQIEEAPSLCQLCKEQEADGFGYRVEGHTVLLCSECVIYHQKQAV